MLGILRISNVLLLSLLTGQNYPPTTTAESVESDGVSAVDVDNVVEIDEGLSEHGQTYHVLDAGESLEVEDASLFDSTTPDEHENSLPASLAKAVLVGAQRRSQSNDDQHPGDDELNNAEQLTSTDANLEGGESRNSKPPLTGCVWGSAGCNKGKWNAVTNSGPLLNSSSANKQEESGADVSTTSSFAGSATAKIKAHVQEARGGSSTSSSHTPLSSMRNTRKTRLKTSTIQQGEGMEKDNESPENRPPQGFELSARIVTSTSDGLSYFLDVPEDPNALEIDNWMMNIPYTYVECGPTVESTTESFPLEDMVVRHFPHAAAMGHWVNLGGGVTIEMANIETADTETKEERHVNESIDGHPKLLVALSPIEITVSGNKEETRTFYPGEVVLMEDTLGKGHKMRAARGTLDNADLKAHGQDLKILMVTLPHLVQYSSSQLNDYAQYHRASSKTSSLENNIQTNRGKPPLSSHYGAKQTIFGTVTKHRANGAYRDYRSASLTPDDTKPCPLEYDSAYSSLFTPSHYHRRSRRRRRKTYYQRGESAFSHDYPPPPGHSTYDEESVLFRFLPSLRRTMLFGVGLSLTSSFVYCVQLLYPPLLALLGGAAFVMGGALINVIGTRWSYRQWLAVWEEEWRWRREIKRHKDAEKKRIEQQNTVLDGTNDDNSTETVLSDDEMQKKPDGMED